MDASPLVILFGITGFSLSIVVLDSEFGFFASVCCGFCCEGLSEMDCDVVGAEDDIGSGDECCSIAVPFSE